MKILLAHPGTQYSHRLAVELERNGLLFQFWTGFVIADRGLLGRICKYLPRFIYRKISNRLISNVPKNKIINTPWNEWRSLISLSWTKDKELVFFKRNETFQSLIPDRIISQCDFVIGFDTSSWILAKRCKELGVKFILDVSIAHPQTKKRVYEQIVHSFPDWRFSISYKDTSLIELEKEELTLADRVVVASGFTRQSLVENNISLSKIVINPYGVDSEKFQPIKKDKDLPINFLFVGSVDARKGIPLLLNGWIKIKAQKKATLTLIGPISEKVKEKIRGIAPETNIMGKVPFKELVQLFPKFDVLIFPSYFEGFALVILEAMASGLPVITTTATCGPEVIEQGKEGFIISPGDANELERVMNLILDSHHLVLKMGASARKKALSMTWQEYGNRWDYIIKNFDNEL